ncbi:molybdopterin-dependent oxidoreductase [Sphingobium sp. CR2-8]|uniref:molybdopterin oxidoreductase family protein n=1 Tax=Sphingobium sp. CR2-8 TaxID=1306534 RepID=UPI002DBB4BD3|nr:molybdopterin-dependent oxidoreductase [Sphingobium sp. CR2-8]MEC3912036.1 molybdopterin-dependent oxidoreductase [Sphingobium sp. CR2-8]
MAIVRSQCGQCGVGCGVRAFVESDRRLQIEGDRLHPANGGRLCSRADALKSMASIDRRLLQPWVDGRQQGWDKAIGQIAKRLSTLIARHGPGSVAMHVGGGLLTEDYYVANKLMKGFFGSAHIHAPWRGATDAMQKAAFGQDVMPGTFEDIDHADLILIAGADIAQAHPVLLERIEAAREEHGATLVRIADIGTLDDVEVDMRLDVMPGSTAQLLAGLLLHAHDSGALDPDDLARRVTAPADFWDRLRSGRDIWSLAKLCRLAPAQIRAFYELVSAHDRVVTLIDADADLLAAAHNYHLATGRIGRLGATPFALTAQSNGMGAREVGCMPSALAAHRDFTPDALAQVGRFWGARHLAQAPGLEDDALLEAIYDGRVKALWSIGADEAAAPWLDRARKAVPLSIRSTDAASETQEGWTIVLPSPAWIEKDGTLTGMDRLISRQRRLFDLPGDVKPDWWALTKVAQAMGWGDAFHYERSADIYREHVRLTAYGNDGSRLLNLKRHAPISNPAYDELTPWRWGEVPFDEGRFPTPDGKPRLLPIGRQPDAATS